MSTNKMSLMTKFEQFVRTICFIIWVFVISTILLIESFFHPLYPKINALSGQYFSRKFKRGSIPAYLVHIWGYLSFQLFGISIVQEFRAEPPKDYKDNCIVMFSHGSNLDPPLIHGTFPFFPCFVAKKTLFKIPVVGTALRLIGQIPIDRANLHAAIETLNTTASIAITEHKTVAIAAEGTRRRSPSTGPDQLLPFKKGPFHLTKAIGADIIPCAIVGSHRLWPPGQIFPSAGTVIIKYLERIPKEFIAEKSVEEVQAEVRRRIAAELGPVPDEVIFSTEHKPYKVFMVFLFGLFVFWTTMLRLFY